MDEQIQYLEAAKYAVAQMMRKGSSGFMQADPETHKLLYHVTWMDVFDFLDEQIEMKESWEGGAE